MASLLVRINDKLNPKDPYLDAASSKKGDVVYMQESGWQWSMEEQNNSDWIIIEVPDAKVADLVSFLTAQPGDPLVDKTLQRRGLKVDVDTLLVQGHKLGVPITVPAATLLSTKIIATQIQDPNIIGPNTAHEI